MHKTRIGTIGLIDMEATHVAQAFAGQVEGHEMASGTPDGWRALLPPSILTMRQPLLPTDIWRPPLQIKDRWSTTEDKPDSAEIGSRDLNWKKVIVTEASGCRWFIIEQDAFFSDPFEFFNNSIIITYPHIRTCWGKGLCPDPL